MTDCKPANTLFNTITNNTTIIDLGGSIRADSKNEFENY